MTMSSRVSGFVRDLLFVQIFGASLGLDAFFVAFRIPNFLRRLFAEGAFSQAFVPVLAEYKEKVSENDVRLFLNNVAGNLLLILFAVTAVAIIVTPWLLYVFAPGYIHDPTRYELTKLMLRITFPYLLFISLTAYVSGILNTYGKFGVPAFTPNLLNFALIGASLWLAPYFHPPVVALAWGVFIGGLLQLLFQLPFLWKLRLLPKPQICLSDKGVKKILKLMLPAVVGVSVAPISLLIDTFYASFLPIGSQSWLYISDRITSFPLGVFGVAIATVILPHLSRKYSNKSAEDFSRTLDWALQSILLIALPAMLGIMLLSVPILTTLLQYGKFSAFDITMAQRSLLGFAIGIPVFMLVKVLASGFYSQQNIKTPVRIAIIAMLSNVVLATILVFPLAHAGLALATSVTSILNAGLLFFTLYKKKFYRPIRGWKIFMLRLLCANVIMAVILYFTNPNMLTWLHWQWFERAWHLGILCVEATLVYAICLKLMGLKWQNFVTFS